MTLALAYKAVTLETHRRVARDAAAQCGGDGRECIRIYQDCRHLWIEFKVRASGRDFYQARLQHEFECGCDNG